MNESINKMTNTISRSSQNQNNITDAIFHQPEENKKAKSKYEDYDLLQINAHLDRNRCNQDLTTCRNKNINSDRLRRLMDQNGVSALILGIMPISNDLCVDI